MCLGCFIPLAKHGVSRATILTASPELDLADILNVGTQRMLIPEVSSKDISAKNRYFLLFMRFNLVNLKHNQGLLPPP